MQYIESLLTRHEDKTLEFKQDFSSPKRILKTLVAFANTAGGVLIIGVTDDKSVFGVDDPLTLEETLTSLVADHIEPLLLPTIQIIDYNNKALVVVEVPFLAGISGTPFFLKQLGSEKGVMVRLGSSTRAATSAMIRELQQYTSARANAF